MLPFFRPFFSHPALLPCVLASAVVVGLGCPPPVTPCPFGAEGPGEPDCVFPWEDGCEASAEGCIAGSSVLCDVKDGAAVPRDACDVCGCSGADACVATTAADFGEFSVCLSADVREGERDAAVVDSGLDDADYVSLMQNILRNPAAAMTRGEAIARWRTRRAEDPRHSLLAIGEDEAGIAERLLAPLVDGSFGKVQGEGSCADVTAGLLEAEDDGTVLLADASAVTESTCLYPGIFPRCAPPSLAACAASVGVVADVVVVIGKSTIIATDNALLRKATRSNRSQWIDRINDNTGVFTGALSQPAQSRFADEDNGVEVRFVVDADERVVFVVVTGAFAQPLQLRAFRDMLSDGLVDAFMQEFDITPNDCEFDVVVGEPAEEDRVEINCQKNGAGITGFISESLPPSTLQLSRP